MADAKEIYQAHPTSDEIAEVLARRLVATVGTLNEDGSIHQGPASTGRHLMVAAEGTARVLQGTQAQELNHRLRAKYIKPERWTGSIARGEGSMTSRWRSRRRSGDRGPDRPFTRRRRRSSPGTTRTPGWPTMRSHTARRGPSLPDAWWEHGHPTDGAAVSALAIPLALIVLLRAPSDARGACSGPSGACLGGWTWPAPLGRRHPFGTDNALHPRSCHPDDHADTPEVLRADPRRRGFRAGPHPDPKIHDEQAGGSTRLRALRRVARRGGCAPTQAAGWRVTL